MVKKRILLVACLATISIMASGCSTGTIRDNTSLNPYSLVTPPRAQLSTNNYLAVSPVISATDKTHPDSEAPGYTQRIFYSSAETVALNDCGIRDRFDRNGLLAFYSDDRRKRLSLHTGGLDEAVMRYSFKLGTGKNRKSHSYNTSCLTDSNVQGLFGSIYHQLNLRDEGTSAFNEAAERMEERGLDFWR